MLMHIREQHKKTNRKSGSLRSVILFFQIQRGFFSIFDACQSDNIGFMPQTALRAIPTAVFPFLKNAVWLHQRIVIDMTDIAHGN